MADGCDMHGYHRPKPLRIEIHHIQPLGMAGPNVAANKVSICPSGHFNVHRLLDDLLHGLPMRRGGTRRERALARQGYDAWVAAGKPGHPVYQLEHP